MQLRSRNVLPIRAVSKVVDENCVKTKISDSHIFPFVKKLKISDDEKKMDGAPVGDLFDIVVKENCDLTALENPSTMLVEAIKKGESSSWAEQYEGIEIIRSICLHHSSMVEPSKLEGLIDQAVAGSKSLRSCCIRNALMCLQIVLSSFGTIISPTYKHIIISTILNKMGGGPKFLCELTEKILVSCLTSTKGLNPLACIECLISSTEHKSPQVVYKAFQYIYASLKLVNLVKYLGSSVVGVKGADACVAVENRVKRVKEAHLIVPIISQVIPVLYQGVQTAKSPLAKECASRSLAYIFKDIPDAALSQLLVNREAVLILPGQSMNSTSAVEEAALNTDEQLSDEWAKLLLGLTNVQIKEIMNQVLPSSKSKGSQTRVSGSVKSRFAQHISSSSATSSSLSKAISSSVFKSEKQKFSLQPFEDSSKCAPVKNCKSETEADVSSTM